MRRLITLSAAFVVLLLPQLAEGAASPISPAEGAVVDGPHPVFSWSLPPNEESDGIYVARSPATTVDGEFFDENIVDRDVFFANEMSWSPTSALPAGAYWWNIWSHDRQTFASSYSAPSSFAIPARVSIASIRIRRYTGLRALDLTVRFAANTEEARVSVHIRRGARIVWSKSQIDEFVSIGETNTASFTWYTGGRIPLGTRLQLVVTVDAADVHASATRSVRAP